MMLKQAQEEIHPHYRRRKAGGEEKRQRGERVTERERGRMFRFLFICNITPFLVGFQL